MPWRFHVQLGGTKATRCCHRHSRRIFSCVKETRGEDMETLETLWNYDQLWAIWTASNGEEKIRRWKMIGFSGRHKRRHEDGLRWSPNSWPKSALNYSNSNFCCYVRAVGARCVEGIWRIFFKVLAICFRGEGPARFIHVTQLTGNGRLVKVSMALPRPLYDQCEGVLHGTGCVS